MKRKEKSTLPVERNKERFKNQLISYILIFLGPIAKAQTVRSSNQCAQKLSSVYEWLLVLFLIGYIGAST